MSALVRWKIVALLLGLCCVVLAYRVFDQGMTRTYLDASQEASAAHIKLLSRLVEHEWLGSNEDQVVSRLQAFVASQPADSIVLERDTETNAMYLDSIRFEFFDGKLKRVVSQ